MPIAAETIDRYQAMLARYLNASGFAERYAALAPGPEPLDQNRDEGQLCITDWLETEHSQKLLRDLYHEIAGYFGPQSHYNEDGRPQITLDCGDPGIETTITAMAEKTRELEQQEAEKITAECAIEDYLQAVSDGAGQAFSFALSHAREKPKLSLTLEKWKFREDAFQEVVEKMKADLQESGFGSIVWNSDNIKEYALIDLVPATLETSLAALREKTAAERAVAHRLSAAPFQGRLEKEATKGAGASFP